MASDPFHALPRPTKAYHTKGYAATSPTRPELSLKGKTVLITGGSSGIGYGMSQAFAQAGASTVAIIARSEGPLEEARSSLEAAYPATNVRAFAASTSDATRINAVVSELGTVDVLVLNAGVSHESAPLLDLAPEVVEENFQTNVLGPLNVLRAFVALPPRAAGAQRTIILASTAGVYLPRPGASVYGASKAAMTYLAGNLASEYGSKGFRVFAFHPAVVYTGMSKLMGHSQDARAWDDVSLPANHAVWLCSSEADFLKGRYTWANWDVEELKAKKHLIEADPSALTISLIMQNQLLA